MNKLRKPPSGFTMVPNAIIRCPTISLKAKGLYCLLFAKPDNWTYVEEALIKESADGRDGFRAGIAELVKSGWLYKQQVQDGNGKFSHTDWHLSVDGKSVDGLAVAGKSVAGKSDTNNTDVNNTDLNKTVSPKAPKGADAVKGFEEVWKARWGRGDAANPKQPALKAYSKAVKSGASHADILQAVKLRRGVGKADTQYAPQLATWLNQERWKDAGTGESSSMSAEEIKAANDRFEEGRRKHAARMKELAEARSRELLGTI